MGEVEPQIRHKRLDRTHDESIYQPRIHSSRIRELYKISQQLDLPLTILVDQALEMYINQLAESQNEGSLNQ